MRIIRFAAVGLLLCAPLAAAQQPDTVRARQRADSIAKAVQDSIALMKELGAAVADTGARQPAPTAAPGGPANPRLLPDISAVGDLVADLSPRGSTQENRARFGAREVEVAIQSVVDPYFRGDVFLGFSDEEGAAIEQAYLTTTSLPNQLELKLGRFLMPFGKQNLTHRHDLHTTEYPYVIQRLFGPEGLKGTGLWGSRVVSPFGFYQELQLTVVDRLSDPEAGLTTAEDVNKSLSGLGFSARLRNYVDISEAANVELSFSALTGRRERALGYSSVVDVEQPNGRVEAVDVNAVTARQTTYGVDFTYRWRPLQQGLYKSFILQSEVMHQVNQRLDATTPALPPCIFPSCTAPGGDGMLAGRDYTGAYVFARYQTSQRTYLGSRYDVLQDPTSDGRTLHAGSVYLEWYPSEFSKLSAGYEAVKGAGDPAMLNRLLLQATFSVGPHKPHPF